MDTLPTFSWTYNDPDGDPQTRFHWDVFLQPGNNLIWTNNQSSTLDTDTYAGPALSRCVDYDLLVEVTDGTLWSFPVTLRFRLISLPPSPTLVSPTSNALHFPATQVPLTWNSVID